MHLQGSFIPQILYFEHLQKDTGVIWNLDRRALSPHGRTAAHTENFGNV